jgi:uncharacterized protein YhfF
MGAGDEVFELGMPGPMRDRLVSAVLAGEKVATSSLLAQYEDEGEPLPIAGECRAMIDSEGEVVALVELVEVSVIRLGDADERLARDEGEGFRSVAEWREAHEDFWRGEIVPELRHPRALDDDTEVVVERFHVIPGSDPSAA